MFTGIIEALGEVKAIEFEKTNVHFTLSSPFTNELKIDQSLAHNGVCLTVVNIHNNDYTVTAIDETLKRTNLATWKKGDLVNLERCMKMDGRLDGHIVQGHVDTIGWCKAIIEHDGSTEFVIGYDYDDITVPKGSVTINGVSLTVVQSEINLCSVHIIPFTIDHTSFKNIHVGDKVNIEFDIIGKYVKRMMNTK